MGQVYEETNAPRNGAKWVEEEDDKMIALLKEGMSVRQIATSLGRTRGAVVARMETLAYEKQKIQAATKILLSH